MDSTFPADSLKPWEVIFWDVGQGDATSIRLPTGEYILIDTGPANTPSYSNPLVQWLLNSPSPKRIKHVFVTHNDLDHAGGLISLVYDEALPIESVLMNNDDTFKQASGTQFNSLLSKLKERGTSGKTRTKFLTQVESAYGDGITRLAVRYPSMLQTAGRNTNNEISAVITLEQSCDGKALVVWGGDTLLSTVADVCCKANPKILVGPHHGAPQDAPNKETTFRPYLEAIQPQALFVSVSKSNQYGHPKKKVYPGGC
jgi:competence protein ComEC